MLLSAYPPSRPGVHHHIPCSATVCWCKMVIFQGLEIMFRAPQMGGRWAAGRSRRPLALSSHEYQVRGPRCSVPPHARYRVLAWPVPRLCPDPCRAISPACKGPPPSSCQCLPPDSRAQHIGQSPSLISRLPSFALFRTAHLGRQSTQYTPAGRPLPIPPRPASCPGPWWPWWPRRPRSPSVQVAQARLHWAPPPPLLPPYAPPPPPTSPPMAGCQARSTLPPPVPSPPQALVSFLSPLFHLSKSPSSPFSPFALRSRLAFLPCLSVASSNREFLLSTTLFWDPREQQLRRSYVRSFDSPVDSASARISTLSTHPKSQSPTPFPTKESKEKNHSPLFK